MIFLYIVLGIIISIFIFLKIKFFLFKGGVIRILVEVYGVEVDSASRIVSANLTDIKKIYKNGASEKGIAKHIYDKIAHDPHYFI